MLSRDTMLDNSTAAQATAISIRPPSLPGLPVLGHLLEMRRDPLGTLRGLAARGDVTVLKLGLHHAHLIVLPEHLEKVLLDDRYQKQFRTYRKMKLVLGEGLVTSNGARWKASRQLAQPGFHRAQIAASAAVMARAAQVRCDGWVEGERDLLAEMLGLSEQIISAALFGAEGEIGTKGQIGVKPAGGEVGEAGAAAREGIAAALGEASSQLSRRMLQIVDLPLWVPTRANRRLRAAIATIDDRVEGFVAARLAGPPRDDLLGLLLAAELDPRQLRDELVTLFTAGQETVGCALAWLFWLLSRHPEAERALHDELASVLSGRAPAVSDLARLPWTRMIVQETLRLHPPLWLLNRTATEEDELGGVRIRKGSQVFFSPYLTHRHPALFRDPDAFRPERFLDEARWPRFAFLPFSGGPRQCIGHAFAMVELQIVLATVAQQWRLSSPDGRDPEPDPGVTLRPKGGLRLRLSRR